MKAIDLLSVKHIVDSHHTDEWCQGWLDTYWDEVDNNLSAAGFFEMVLYAATIFPVPVSDIIWSPFLTMK